MRATWSTWCITSCSWSKSHFCEFSQKSNEFLFVEKIVFENLKLSPYLLYKYHAAEGLKTDNLSDNPTACAVDFRFEPDAYLFYVNFKNNKKMQTWKWRFSDADFNNHITSWFYKTNDPLTACIGPSTRSYPKNSSRDSPWNSILQLLGVCGQTGNWL